MADRVGATALAEIDEAPAAAFIALDILTEDEGGLTEVSGTFHELFLGRDPSCRVHLADRHIGRRRARFVFDRGRWRLHDLGGAEPLHIVRDGVEVALGPNARTIAIRADDIIRICGYDTRVLRLEERDDAAADPEISIDLDDLLEGDAIPPEVIALVDGAVAAEHRLVPIRLDGGALVIAVEELPSPERLEALRFILGRDRIIAVVANRSAIEDALLALYDIDVDLDVDDEDDEDESASEDRRRDGDDAAKQERERSEPRNEAKKEVAYRTYHFDEPDDDLAIDEGAPVGSEKDALDDLEFLLDGAGEPEPSPADTGAFMASDTGVHAAVGPGEVEEEHPEPEPDLSWPEGPSADAPPPAEAGAWSGLDPFAATPTPPAAPFGAPAQAAPADLASDDFSVAPVAFDDPFGDDPFGDDPFGADPFGDEADAPPTFRSLMDGPIGALPSGSLSASLGMPQAGYGPPGSGEPVPGAAGGGGGAPGPSPEVLAQVARARAAMSASGPDLPSAAPSGAPYGAPYGAPAALPPASAPPPPPRPTASRRRSSAAERSFAVAAAPRMQAARGGGPGIGALFGAAADLAGAAAGAAIGAAGAAIEKMQEQSKDRDAKLTKGGAAATKTGARGTRVVKSYERRTTVRWWSRMNPNRTFPMLVIFSLHEVEKIVAEAVEQVQSKTRLKIKESDPFVKVVPHIPGCLVVPPELDVDTRPAMAEGRFHVTPIAEGDFDDAYVELHYEGKVVDKIPIPTRSVAQTATKAAGFFAVASPVLSQLLETYGIDVADRPAEAATFVSRIVNALGGTGNAGWTFMAGLAVTTLVLYLKRRPKAAPPMTKFFDTAALAPDANKADEAVAKYKARLLVFAPKTRRIFPIEKKTLEIGSAPSADIRIEAPGIEDSHVAIAFGSDGAFRLIARRGGGNTTVNGEPLGAGGTFVLEGDVFIQLGGGTRVSLWFYIESRDERLDDPTLRQVYVRLVERAQETRAAEVRAAFADPGTTFRAGVAELVIGGALPLSKWRRLREAVDDLPRLLKPKT